MYNISKRNALLLSICAFFYAPQISILQPRITIFTSAQQCTSDNDTCAQVDESKCQVETKANCNKKEKEYIKKMTRKTPADRMTQIRILRDLLTKDEKVYNPILLPWVRARLHILYSLENLDPTALDEAEAEKKAEEKAAAEAAARRSREEAEAENEAKKQVDDAVETIRRNAAGERLIYPEELAHHHFAQRRIWLSILGKVYDVTAGEKFYGPEGAYFFYAGRDASPCFSTGINNPKGARERLEEWEGKRLMAVLHWAQFYENHETYEYLGLLAGSKYYDKDGNEEYVRNLIISKAEEAKANFDAEKEMEKMQKLEKRRKKKEATGAGEDKLEEL